MTKPRTTHPFSIRLKPRLVAALKEVAQKEARTQTAIVERALMRYLEQAKKEVRG